MNDALITVLKEYGLNQKEAMIYLIVLELGKAPASTIARQTGLKRVTAYAIIQEMIRKGVLNELEKKGVKSFSVVDPQQLHAQREVKCKAFASSLPEFAALADIRGNKPKIQYFEGFNGILEIYEDMLTSKVDICAFVGVDGPPLNLRKKLNGEHAKKRASLGIYAKVISPLNKNSKEYQSSDQYDLRETRLIKDSNFQLNNEIDMYGPGKISIIMFSGDEMTGIIVHSNKSYQSLKSIFNFTWKNVR